MLEPGDLLLALDEGVWSRSKRILVFSGFAGNDLWIHPAGEPEFLDYVRPYRVRPLTKEERLEYLLTGTLEILNEQEKTKGGHTS
ncbi:hypothetical protein [Marinobacterium litorale]|uniref:hypothetical protein n=1 Tax=Marinobacterium litorale TaxID=404770 RepID=UPI00041EFC2C|nr:hypothetical protein [Marinobacterium litorale]